MGNKPTEKPAEQPINKDPRANQERKPGSKNSGKPWNQNKSHKNETNPRPHNDGTKTSCTSNALEWHNKLDIFKLATHISQFKLAGKQVTPTSNSEAVTFGNRISIFEMAITPGTVLGTGDPFNKAIIDLFNRVRGKYTSTIPFQANDLGTVILAVANIISLISAMDRVLDTLGYISFKSALTPEILHAALVGDVNNATIKAGYDADVYNSPNLKLALEIQVRRLQGLFMPKMALFDFAGWIFRHVYFEDQEGLRGDMSAFKPSYIAKWSSTVAVIGATGVYASGLEYKDINSYLVSPNPHDARIYLAAITDCIDALVQDDNVRTICGWLHQYIPESPTVSDLVQASRESSPDKNPEMDLFVAGMTFVPTSNFAGKFVAQDVINECLNFTMTPRSAMAPVSNWMINYHKAPSDDEVGLSMIFTALYKDGYVYSDPFVATDQRIYRRATNGVMQVGVTDHTFDLGSVTAAYMLQCHEGMQPTSLLYNQSGGTITSASLYAECEYQVVITPENAFNVHYASISSLLSVADVKRDA